jgi:hypothetical protein
MYVPRQVCKCSPCVFPACACSASALIPDDVCEDLEYRDTWMFKLYIRYNVGKHKPFIGYILLDLSFFM